MVDPRKLHSSTQRKSMDTAEDPYLADLEEKDRDMAICTGCRAVYHNKRWYLDEGLYKKAMALKEVHKVLCPACRKIRDRFPGGIVILSGDFLKKHREEIMNLIRNEEERAKGKNPLERIMEIKEEEGHVEITTTNERLAQRIGSSLEKAYQGRVEYRWSEDGKLLRVWWER